MSTSTTPDVEQELQEIVAAGRASSADYAAIEGVEFAPVALTVTDETIDRDRWAAILRVVGPDRAKPWHVGDLLAFGERSYGDGTYQLAADALGYTNVGSLRNLASVSRRVVPEVRQPTLSHRAHRVVAAMDRAEQERWLTLAVTEGWTAADLGREITAASFPTGQNRDLDHAKHWGAAGMPGYEPTELPYKVVVNFDDELERDFFLAGLGEPTVHNSSGRTLSIWQPDRPMDDVRSVALVPEVEAA